MITERKDARRYDQDIVKELTRIDTSKFTYLPKAKTLVKIEDKTHADLTWDTWLSAERVIQKVNRIYGIIELLYKPVFVAGADTMTHVITVSVPLIIDEKIGGGPDWANQGSAKFYGTAMHNAADAVADKKPLVSIGETFMANVTGNTLQYKLERATYDGDGILTADLDIEGLYLYIRMLGYTCN